MPTITLSFDLNNRLKVKKDKANSYDSCIIYDSAENKNFLDKLHWQNKDYDCYIDYHSNHTSPDLFLTWDALQSAEKSEALTSLLDLIEPYLINISYLKFNQTDYVYRFRNKKERNTQIYKNDRNIIYQSQLCSTIKAIRRIKEKISNDPITLNFGAVEYILPSHFGFCLGVQNAIERAYETIANYPDRRIYMLSELIHNPFVNNDLNKRGLKYLQTDKGQWLDADGKAVVDMSDISALWNQLKLNDIVIIPAFGATHEDKIRLIKKGISLKEFDATCMLVEKVWKAIKKHSEEGFTTLIHGKYYHEETKATFSNALSYGPALILANIEEAKLLGSIIMAPKEAKRKLFDKHFINRCSPGFNPDTDLEKIAVVNQTTLLRNLTIEIINYFRELIIEKYGEANRREHLWDNEKGDTLCYATQVNQDALIKALSTDLDHALVIGGKNSSNTYQLYQICARQSGEKAHYIQSEANIQSIDTINHYVYSQSGDNTEQTRPFINTELSTETHANGQPKQKKPVRILITGGASCPDGIIQQVISKINEFFPKEELRSMESVLDELNEIKELEESKNG
jgi:4-hydroxy-3-methylbut-2-enyl diphosphate reductase